MSSPSPHDADASPASAATPAEAGPRRHPWLVRVGIAIVLVVLVRLLLVQTYYVPSASMEPTVNPGDRVLVNKLTGPHDIHRGDVIVFNGTTAFGGPDLTPYQSDSLVGRALADAASLFSIDLGEKDYLKRVVGLPGDQVACCTDGRLTVNGQQVTEAYLPAGQPASAIPFDVVVPAGRLFVLGDNRPESSDSRAHLGDPGGGTVPVDDVIGTVLWRYWPLSRIGSVPGSPQLRAVHDEGGGS